MTTVRFVALFAAALLLPSHADAQALTTRGFGEITVTGYPETTDIDTTRAVGQTLFQAEASLKRNDWRVDGSLEARWDTHQTTSRDLDVSYWDRTIQRPPLAVRSASVSWSHGAAAIDIGKQFIRWGRTDILIPTDRFAPRDDATIVDPEVLAVTAGRLQLTRGIDSLDIVVTPRLTPSRMPLLNQRWTVLPAAARLVPIEDNGAEYPTDPHYGFRWNHVGSRLEYSVSYFHGDNSLPLITSTVEPRPIRIDVVREYPRLTSFGADTAVPLRLFTIKAESAWFGSPNHDADEFLLYVVQLERQAGEWLLFGGYNGEYLSRQQNVFQFSPDRGIAKAFFGRASSIGNPNRTVTIEAVVRQNGEGLYGKFEYSWAFGQHWRTTATVTAFGGSSDDFLGQYHHNSAGAVALRYSF